MSQPPPEKEDLLSVHTGSPDTRGRSVSPWTWIPTANFASGLPYVVAMTLTVVVYKNMGISNALIGLWTSLLYLPWVIKPLWGPLVDRYWTKRAWVVTMQVVLAVAFGAIMVAIQMPTTPAGEVLGGWARAAGIGDLPLFFAVSIGFLWLAALASATHDIAVDGFYMLALREKQQAFFIGIRSTFYRLAVITGTGVLPLVAGIIQSNTGPMPVELPTYLVVEGEAREEFEAGSIKAYDAAASLAERGQALIVEPAELEVPAKGSAEVGVRLAVAPPENEEVVVLVTRRSGDKGLGVASGERLVYTSENWDQPQTVTIKAAEKSLKPVNATIKVASGNIRLSWTVVFLSCASLFLMLAIYHHMAFPFPQQDTGTAKEQPIILKPIFWLVVALGIPTVIIIILYQGMGLIGQPIVDQFVLDNQLTTSQANLAGVVWSTIRFLILIGLGFILFYAPGIREEVRDWFRETSARSDIGFSEVFGSFFAKRHIAVVLAFILLFRLGEALIVKLGPVFLTDTRENMGLGMTLGQFGIVYGTVGLACLVIGGIIGGWAIASFGLKRAIWPLVACMHLPNLLYVYMAVVQPEDLVTPILCVGIEQLGYGIGFASFMMYLIFAAQGPYKTAHYALCTGFMALGMMIPGMWSGYLQEAIGYTWFFVCAFLFVLPGVALIPFLPMDESFGRKKQQ